MCLVAVVDPPDGEVPVQLPGVDDKFKVVHAIVGALGVAEEALQLAHQTFI